MKLTLLSCLSILLLLSCQKTGIKNSKLDFSNKLLGHWKAKAFSGELHEKWNLTADGWLLQEGHYIEKNDTTYSAQTKIEKIDNELILFSVIKNSNPKIFKAIVATNDSIVFENSDYKNPYRVKYKFQGIDNYQRTITGLESDSLVTYKFNFEKIK